ncbi:hypothetical protein ABFX02_10G176800 [Erythranthe guttata]
MAKRRYALEISNINEDPMRYVDRSEIMQLTKVAKSWEFTCSFCFKKFASAQAMGGHQNAHRSERLEEKRLFVRDPIGYRKRAYLRAMKDGQPAAAAAAGERNPSRNNLHAPPKTAAVKNEFVASSVNSPTKSLPNKAILIEEGVFGEFNAGKKHFFKGSTSKNPLPPPPPHVVNNINNKINDNNNKKVSNGGDHENVKSDVAPSFVVMNFFPPKELNLAESVGVNAKGKACVCEFNIINGGYGINLEHDLDLTLKL